MVTIPNTHYQEILASNANKGCTDTESSIIESEQQCVAIKAGIDYIVCDHIFKEFKILGNHCVMVDHLVDTTV